MNEMIKVSSFLKDVLGICTGDCLKIYKNVGSKDILTRLTLPTGVRGSDLQAAHFWVRRDTIQVKLRGDKLRQVPMYLHPQVPEL